MFGKRLIPICTIAVLAMSATVGLMCGYSFAAEKAVAPEHNPPGDIPDNQVFIAYVANGFAMKVPEGWSRKDIPGGVSFSDKYNLIDVSIAPAAAAPTVEEVKAHEAKDIAAGGHAEKISNVAAVKLQSGPAVRIDYQSNSQPNAVTGKKIRLERVRYLFFKAGRLVTLDMAAPLGADNVDQWLLMANSVSLP
ncbi:hypothetical protein [Rhizobium sp. BK376]|uniref:hypothetical protein n=1 Tax=Rhizobium sp. BK376 TaxID=2512149 RepID=UPI00104E3EF7|nr:hypothetical protein [Rhizobium sp. BK376]TCR85270.1 hypothetical protein EV561_10741 [Rhizobium sp. BK376]